MLYALFFLLGVFTNKLGYFILQIEPMYKFWKLAEYGALKILAEAEVLRLQAILILKLSYEEANRQEEICIVEEKINKIHLKNQKELITLMRKLLPYQTSYNTPEEAFKAIEHIIKEGEETDE